MTPTVSPRGQAQAYLATRAPATFAATRKVLAELASLRPGWAPESILDLGAGPGTATWAAMSVFGSIEHAELVEREPDMAALGVRPRQERLAVTCWLTLRGPSQTPQRSTTPKSDLVVAAYVLGELATRPGAHGARAVVGGRRWRAGAHRARDPGRLRTAAGRKERAHLLGAQVTAPCPHDDACPMAGSDWCHFAVRLERSTLHRELKASTARVRGREVLVPGRVGEPAACARGPAGALAAPAQGSRAALAVRGGWSR